jgi:hypothetical protein
MNISELRKLNALSAASVEVLERDAPELFADLQERRAEVLKSRLKSGLAREIPELEARVEQLDVGTLLETGAEVQPAVLEALDAPGLSPEAATALAAMRDDGGDLIADPVLADRPLREQPVLAEELLRAELAAVGSVAGLDDRATTAVLERAGSVEALGGSVLPELVEAGALEPEDAERLALTAELYTLLDRDVALVEGVAPRVSRPGELAALRPAEWEEILATAGVAAADVPAYAVDLADRAAARFPSDALIERLAPRDVDTLVAQLEAMTPQQLEAVAVRYPGLGVTEVVEAPGLPQRERAVRIVGRIQVLSAVLDANPGVELLDLDYSLDSADVAALQTPGLSPEERDGVLTALKAYQRVSAVTEAPDTTEALLSAGYRSALDVVNEPVEALQAKAELEPETAARTHAAAVATFEATLVAFGSVMDIATSDREWSAVSNLGASAPDYLRRLDGYDTLFGRQSACRCRHCQSIVSPAAYFVDLMRFVEDHVLEKVFTGTRATSELHLQRRRPDLWDLPLTCRNTEELVPTLDLINEILENAVARAAGFTGPITNRTAVEKVVYQDTLSTGTGSLRQPFWLPLEKLEAFLRHSELSRADVAGTVGATAALETAAALAVSDPEHALLITVNTDPEFLGLLFGRTLAVAPDASVGPLPAHELARALDVTREELGALLESAFVAAGGGGPIVIRAEKAAPESVQNDVERVHGLTTGALDRVHRLFRLWRATRESEPRWTIPELDLVLTQTSAGALGATQLGRIARVRRCQLELGWTTEESCGAYSNLPRRAVTEGATPLFDRLFNPPAAVAADGAWPKTSSFVHPAFRRGATPDAAAPALHRLLAGLQLDDDALWQLISELSGPLGLDLDSTDAERKGFPLTLLKLTLLWRHARLAEHLELSIPQLFQLIRLAGPVAVTSLAELEQVLDFHRWWKSTGRALDDLAFATRGRVLDRTAYPTPADVAAEVADGVAADRALVFADTVFAFLPGVTEEASRAVIAANAALFEPDPGGAGLRLKPTYSPGAAVAIPPKSGVTAARVHEVLARYHAAEIVPDRVAAALGIDRSRMRELLATAGVGLGSRQLAEALRDPAARGPLVSLVDTVLPLTVLFDGAAFDAPALAFIRGHREMFGLQALPAVDVPAARAVWTYARLATAADEGFSTAAPAIDSADLHGVLAAFTKAEGFRNADQAALARVLGAAPGLVTTLHGAVPLPPAAPEALDKLGRCAALARRLGVGGDALALILATDYPGLARAADAMVGAFRARYADEEAYREDVAPYEDRLRSRRRDALVDHLIHAVGLPFDTRSNLYHHFLIDVELEGCARTTRVAAAISSVQLYVHRIRMNLEQDAREPDDPAHVHILPTSIPADEWAWRRHYRVWEANRKVFLYPENYLEPQLRDDKTPLFEALESALLQQEVTDDNVVAAYSKYLGDFDEAANLTVAGAYHDIDPSPAPAYDTLHLIGATATDPPTFHHRTVENLRRSQTAPWPGVVWGPWRKIDVQIAARSASPVVYRGALHVFWTQIVTKPTFRVVGGTSTFSGYQHKMAVKYTTLRADGRWTPPQELTLPADDAWPPARDASNVAVREAGLILDPLPPNGVVPRFAADAHLQPREDYTLRGPNWDRLHVEARRVGSPVTPAPYLSLTARNFSFFASVDLHRRVTRFDTPRLQVGGTAPVWLCEREFPGQRRLHIGRAQHRWEDYTGAFANLVLEDRRITTFLREPPRIELGAGLYEQPIALIDKQADLLAIAGTLGEVIVQGGRDVLLLQQTDPVAPRYLLRRLGTTLSEALSERLFLRGLDSFLSTEHQIGLQEARPGMTLMGPVVTPRIKSDGLDWRGPYGTYYRELFFHTPSLIASHLSSQQQFAAAQRWMHHVFDPTAEPITRTDLRSVAMARGPEDELHVFLSTAGGALLHTIQYADGTWQTPTDVKAVTTDPGQIGAIACAADQRGDVHVCGMTPDGGLWHTIRFANGTWQSFLGDVRGAAGIAGRVDHVACATDSGNQLHVCFAIQGIVSRTLRRIDGSWLGQPVPAVSAATFELAYSVACTIDAADALHVFFTASNGTLWHFANGALTNVNAKLDRSLPFRRVAVAFGEQGHLHVVASAFGGEVWHAVRHPNGDWHPRLFDVEGAAGALPRPTAAVAVAGGGDGSVRAGVVSGGSLWRATRGNVGGWKRFVRGLENERDRNWRYAEFRGLALPSLRAALTDASAIEAYRRDPFNPHAIARLRLTAYQKSVVMRYIDNLLDWGDSLFSEFTTESVNEATLLYVMARDILGPRPTELGDCGEGAVEPRTYAKIAPLLDSGSEFLVEIETLVQGGGGSMMRPQRLDIATTNGASANGDGGLVGAARPIDWSRLRLVTDGGGTATSFGTSLVSQLVPVFCIPANPELRQYWDRVEDRLVKIRSCKDIAGVRRELAPFAPEIDPRLLVRARAAGLSLEDVLGAASGNLPPYRFTHLIERAKSHTATVQAFGAALLAAVEKKDVEELTRLRAVHQQNVLSLTTQVRRDEADTARDASETLERQMTAARYRRDYYTALAAQRLIPAEHVQLASRGVASDLQIAAGALDTLAGIAHLIPNLGSPFAITFGGKQLGTSARSWSGVMRDAAGVAEAVGASAGLSAGFDRRTSGWLHQAELAKHDLAVLDKQLSAARIREKLAERALLLHERSIEQAEELFELYGSKFSNLGLYMYLSTTLQRLYREAFNGAQSMARLAEQAFRFERGDDTTPLLGTGHWDASHAGLLAGERLMMDLLALERRYVETNYRGMEVDQAFSLTQINPAALVRLRETGECTFELPEVFFDVFYPGQYRRRIKAARLTIPSITGPYVNVSATLTLLESHLRSEPKLGATNLKPVPRRRSVSVATSTAQADSGVFEMSFRDERYMPFEGQGAVSKWQLTLPKTFMPFDYQTINDVVLTLSYTAEHDETLRAQVEEANATREGAIGQYLRTNPLARVFSLRQDFSAAFHRLLHNPVGTAVEIEITRKYFPAFLGGKGFKIDEAVLALRCPDGQSLKNVGIAVGSATAAAFEAKPVLGSLPGATLTGAFPAQIGDSHKLVFKVTGAGDLAPAARQPGDVSALDPDKLLDVLLYVKYRLPAPA